MKLQLTLIPDDVPFDKNNPVPILDADGKHLGHLTWAQRYVGRSEMPWPDQVVLTLSGVADAMQVFHYIWTEAMGQTISWRKPAALDPEEAAVKQYGRLMPSA
jgi:hypothetical protein